MIILMVALSVMILSSALGHENDVCSFNRLCTCRSSHHEVICRGVPFLEFPAALPEGVYQVTIIRSGIETLDNNIFQGSSVASLHLMHNNIIHISHKAFSDLENILTTLDLSNNRLYEFPFAALRNLNNLQWLNLHGNQINSIHSFKWSQLNSKAVINNLFLGSNHITNVPDGAFVRLSGLNLLDLEGNLINDVGIHPFPITLTSLSLSNNILQQVPLHAIYSLKNLKYLYLSGNLIHEIPSFIHLNVERMEKLELSNNLLKELPERGFNVTFTIKEIHLEFNFLRILSANSFKLTKVERLVIANNRISDVHCHAFQGIEETLKTLDLSFNLIEQFPSAISSLKSLIYVSLKSNQLRYLNGSELHGSRGTLEVLDLSGNILSSVPKLTLKHLSKLIRLSLQDNKIHKIYRDDFQGWGKSLTTLSLANNKMTYLSAETFIHLTKLKELKLSFNNLMYLDRKVFFPLKRCLEFLDLSSAFSSFNHPVYTFVSNLERLEWLQLDHNNISEISYGNTKNVSKLRHLDFSYNKLKEIPLYLFNAMHYNFISVVHISCNDLGVIRTATFSNVPRLTSVVLFGNKISEIESKAFKNCQFLHTVVLSRNNLTYISSSVFYNLSRLSSIYLQDNQLDTFSFDIIEGETSQLYINVSNNVVRNLEVGNYSLGNIYKIRTLDLTNNQISVIPYAFLSAASKYLLHLLLSKNVLTNISFPPLPVLQVLDLSHNNITEIDSEYFECCTDVQLLMMNNNKISNISNDAFRNSSNIRILDLSNNQLTILAENILSNTKIERLNLSGNNFLVPPSAALHKIRDSLRHLDLSFNKIENLSASIFSSLHKLKALNLSSNQISFLHEMSFYGLSHLLELDVSHNTLRYIGDETVFSSLISLRSLQMRNASLISVCSLPTPLLNVLNLRDNFLLNVSEIVFGISQNVRYLDLSGNLLQDIPLHIWPNTRMLVALDVSKNPIETLGINSFYDLQNLQSLDISGLVLKRLDSRTLHSLRYLTAFKTDSYSSVRSFRLQDLLSHGHAVRKVTLNVEESTLSHQVQRAFGTKLRELIITGSNLERILPDAFAGLFTHELTIRICGTKVRQFPDGLLRYLPDVRYLTLDLRNNLLSTMGPGVLAAVTRYGTDIHQTQHIAGGVLLEENPWNCSCDLLWLGKWLKRWLRETFHMHMLNIEAALYVNSVSRNAKCSVPGSNISLSIIDLRKSDVQCASVINKVAVILSSCWTSLMVVISFIFQYFTSAQTF